MSVVSVILSWTMLFATPTESEEKISVQDWQVSSWSLLTTTPVEYSMHGYFRLRGHFLHKVYSDLPSTHPSFTGADMKLRVSPLQFQYQKVYAAISFDIFKNQLLGNREYTSLQDTIPHMMDFRWQYEPEHIHVRHAWVGIDLFQQKTRLLIGRLPNHFGLGMHYNNGNDCFSDYGDAVDRLQLIYKLGSLITVLSYDFIASGFLYAPNSQLIDFDGFDDAQEISLLIGNITAKQEILQQVSQGKNIFSFAIMPIYRHQQGTAAYPRQTNSYNPTMWPDIPLGQLNYATDGKAFILNFYTGWFTPLLSIEVEGLIGYHEFKPFALQRIHGWHYGLAFEGYLYPSLFTSRLVLYTKAGMASGDADLGFGSNDDWESQAIDGKYTAFQFDRAYQIDLILFRQKIGTITDAYYIKPGISYYLNHNINIDASLLYAHAIFAQSTPSLNQHPLGMELDIGIYYITSLKETSSHVRLPPNATQPHPGTLILSLQYGIMAPLHGMLLAGQTFSSKDIEQAAYLQATIAF